MWIVRLALRRPYTFVVVSLLILLLAIGACIEAPKDIYPWIDIPATISQSGRAGASEPGSKAGSMPGGQRFVCADGYVARREAAPPISG